MACSKSCSFGIVVIFLLMSIKQFQTICSKETILSHQSDDFDSSDEPIPTHNRDFNDMTKAGNINFNEAAFLPAELEISRQGRVDKHGLVNDVEDLFMIHYNMRPLDIGKEKSKELIATEEMIDRMTAIQEMVVRVRTLMLIKILERAWKITTDILYQFPHHHGCAVQFYNEFIRSDWPEAYPDGLLNTIEQVKEALLFSQVERMPIAQVDETVFKGLDFILNRFGDKLSDHGKSVYKSFEMLVINQKRLVRKFCEIPRRANNPFDGAPQTKN